MMLKTSRELVSTIFMWYFCRENLGWAASEMQVTQLQVGGRCDPYYLYLRGRLVCSSRQMWSLLQEAALSREQQHRWAPGWQLGDIRDARGCQPPLLHPALHPVFLYYTLYYLYYSLFLSQVYNRPAPNSGYRALNRVPSPPGLSLTIIQPTTLDPLR